jgi:F0F1-type ATP synthase membrane subunit a
LLNALFTGIYNFLSSILHEKTKVFFPLLAAYFFYILSNNWFGLMPTVGSLLIRPFETGITHASEVKTNSTAGPAVSATEESHNTAKEVASESHKIPFLRANNADLNTTFALALITVSLIQFYGMKYNGVGQIRRLTHGIFWIPRSDDAQSARGRHRHTVSISGLLYNGRAKDSRRDIHRAGKYFK